MPHQVIWLSYTGRWWVGCYIWYSEEGLGGAPSRPRPSSLYQNVTAHPSTASLPITVLLYNNPLLYGFNVAINGWLKSISGLDLKGNGPGVGTTVKTIIKPALRDGDVFLFVCLFVTRHTLVWKGILVAAMLCKRGLCRHAVCVCVSVCLSRSYILSKRINLASKFFHHRVATPV